MNRLFIDTSSDYLSILLVKNNIAVSYVKIFAGRKMSEILLTQVDNIFKLNNLTINDIDDFYCIIGPGSFTGVRIGVAFTLGLSSGVGKEAYGITSLDAYALAKNISEIKVAAVLKDNIYAVRSYDFSSGVFSDIDITELSEENKDGLFFVNSNGSETVDIKGLFDNRFYTDFRQNCLPIYLRKAEAELSFDKKSCN